MCRSPFVNSLNFGSLYCIVMSFLNFDRTMWRVGSDGGTVLAPRGLRGPRVADMLMFMSGRPSGGSRRVLTLTCTHNNDVVSVCDVWNTIEGGNLVRGNLATLQFIFVTPRRLEMYDLWVMVCLKLSERNAFVVAFLALADGPIFPAL